MSARDDQRKLEEPFERAKLPMVIAAVGVAGGLAIAGSVERTAGGAIVLGAWVLGIAALHRLGRAGSVSREPAKAEPKAEAPEEPEEREEAEESEEPAPASDDAKSGD